MKAMKVFLTVSLTSLALLNLGGCSSMLSSKMPSGSASMAQTYNAAINGADNSDQGGGSMAQIRSKVGAIDSESPSYVGYTQTEANQIDNLFPTLPNPNLVMYIYPHLAGTGSDQTPVPGYSTVFPIYAQNNYAMPGEISK